MRPRFFAPDLDPDCGQAVLSADEAHHLTRVLRLGIGAEVGIFDGRGREYVAQVTSTRRGAVTVRLVSPIQDVTAPPVALRLVQSILKSDAMDTVVRDCTMVGVESIQPIVSERTTVKASTLPKAIERWRRVALASTKQCGRSTLPAILEPVPFDKWLNARGADPTFLLVEPSVSGPEAIKVRDLCERPAPERASLVIGPEGGWTAAERDLAIHHGCAALSLGRLTLRAEAAPLAASTALLAVWDV
jgi:16S rRNA (uracil1498-N3)-methyltransferase